MDNTLAQKEFTSEGRATLIGSLPHNDHKKAQQLVFKYIDEIPIWVQLPLYPNERLLSQFVSGLPGIRYNGDTVFFDTDAPEFEAEFLQFFEEYLAVKEGEKAIEGSIFALNKDNGKGFFVFLDDLSKEKIGKRPYALKGQITGPFTMLTGIKDRQGKLSFYNQQLREAVTQGLSLKAAFQVKMLKEHANNVIIFLDEPALSGFGSSAMVSISKKDVQHDLKIVIDEIHEAGAIAGVHVCANTEWDVLLDPYLSVDILSFDAFGFLDRFLIYKRQIIEFIERGGVIAWGIVPTQRPEDIEREDAESLLKSFDTISNGLGLSIAQITKNALITPSCGTGLLSVPLAERVLSLTREVSMRLREQ